MRNNDLVIGEDSDARDFGVDTSFDTDILGNMRDETPDLGAYNFAVFED